jgi:RimJ/RimL family protein N-acetyltransferase
LNSSYSPEAINLRQATIADAQLLFDWANDKDVRRNAIHSEAIEWENHLKWLSAKLNTSTKLFILEYNGEAAGQIRFDWSEEEQGWMVDYSVSESFRGKGLGKRLIEAGIAKLNLYPVLAFVKPENTPSIKVFEALSFNNLGTVQVRNIALIKFSKAKI